MSMRERHLKSSSLAGILGSCIGKHGKWKQTSNRAMGKKCWNSIICNEIAFLPLSNLKNALKIHHLKGYLLVSACYERRGGGWKFSLYANNKAKDKLTSSLIPFLSRTLCSMKTWSGSKHLTTGATFSGHYSTTYTNWRPSLSVRMICGCRIWDRFTVLGGVPKRKDAAWLQVWKEAGAGVGYWDDSTAWKKNSLTCPMSRNLSRLPTFRRATPHLNLIKKRRDYLS